MQGLAVFLIEATKNHGVGYHNRRGTLTNQPAFHEMGFYLSGSQWSFGHIWIYLDVFGIICKRCGQNAMKKEIDTSQTLIAAHPFYFEWGTDNACYLHV